MTVSPWLTFEKLKDLQTQVSSLGGADNPLPAIPSDDYYVRLDGDDANDGLSDSSSGAFATVQRFIDEIYSYRISQPFQQITCWLGDGEHEIPVITLPDGRFTFKSTSADPSLCTIKGTVAGFFTGAVRAIGEVDFEDITIQYNIWTLSAINSYSNNLVDIRDCIINVREFNIVGTELVMNSPTMTGNLGTGSRWLNISDKSRVTFLGTAPDFTGASVVGASYFANVERYSSMNVPLVTVFANLLELETHSYAALNPSATGVITRDDSSFYIISGNTTDYDNTSSSLISTTKQGAIDEVASGTIFIPGPFADDTAAAGGGVGIGNPYYTAAGDMKVRLT